MVCAFGRAAPFPSCRVSAALASIPSLHIQVQANKKNQSYSSDNILKHVI